MMLQTVLHSSASTCVRDDACMSFNFQRHIMHIAMLRLRQAAHSLDSRIGIARQLQDPRVPQACGMRWPGMQLSLASSNNFYALNKGMPVQGVLHAL